LNEGKVVGGQLVVARRHPTTLFDPVEEPLDLVASTVEIGAEADRIAAVAFRRDVGSASSIDPDLRRESSFPASRTSWASPGLSASRTGRPLLSTTA